MGSPIVTFIKLNFWSNWIYRKWHIAKRNSNSHIRVVWRAHRQPRPTASQPTARQTCRSKAMRRRLATGPRLANAVLRRVSPVTCNANSKTSVCVRVCECTLNRSANVLCVYAFKFSSNTHNTTQRLSHCRGIPCAKPNGRMATES